jgi:excisionase family DNA binding protein
MKKYFKSTEAAKYLGISRSSLSNWVRQELLNVGTTPGGHYRFTKDELDKFALERGFEISGFIDNEQTRILVIDDDEMFRRFMSEALEVFDGYELREAKDGMEGALILGSWNPDLVVADLRMPNMNGIEFCRLLRKNENTSDVEVIVASAYLSPEVKDELSKLGVTIVMEKPVRLTALVAAIEKSCGLKLR